VNRDRLPAVLMLAVPLVACTMLEPQEAQAPQARQSADPQTDKYPLTGSRTRSESAFVRSVVGQQPVADMMQRTNTVSTGKSGP